MKIARFRSDHHPNCWVLTDFTMEQIELALEQIEKIRIKQRELADVIPNELDYSYDLDNRPSCKLCIYFEDHISIPNNSIGGCTYMNDWLYKDLSLRCDGFEKRENEKECTQ